MSSVIGNLDGALPLSSHDLAGLSAKVEHFSDATVLCIGDLILDNFVYGAVERISPEAPVPVLRIDHEETMLGGAGNVVRNMLSLGAKSYFVSVVGDDATGSRLTQMVGQEEHLEAYLIPEKTRTSTIKTRYVAGTQQLLRADSETVTPIEEATLSKITRLVATLAKQANAVVISDYAKGLLTPTLVAEIIREAKANNKPVIIDPKGRDYSVYKGATVVTPNVNELAQATGMNIQGDEAVVEAARKLIRECGIENVLVTRNRDGMTLVKQDGSAQHFPTTAQEVFDVSGAGDTAVACLATAIASGVALEDAAYLSNIAGGIAVTRVGTSTIYRTELKTALLSTDLVLNTRKILPFASALQQIDVWRGCGKKIGFTNGCFDLIHPGHVSLMAQAKAECDKLVVGLNSDDSVKRLKGETRPVQNEMARALVLASIESVDMVVIFREDTPMKLIEGIRPDVLVKGKDYTIQTVVGADFVQSYGGRVALANLSEGQSTSNIIKRMAT